MIEKLTKPKIVKKKKTEKTKLLILGIKEGL